MKKIKIIIITIIIIIIGVMSVIYVNKPRPIAKTTSSVKSNADLAFAVLGDVHGNIDNFQRSINDLYTINPGMDALVLNGDTVDQGSEKQYNSVKKALSKNKDLLPKTIIENIGNHEFLNYGAGVNSSQQVRAFISRYLEFSGEEEVYHDKWVNGYHFISLGSEDGNSKTVDSIKAFISKNQQNWLKEKLAEDYKKGKPIFVFLHQPLFFKFGSKTYVGVKQSQQIKEILSQYPEVILFSSHTHSDLEANSVELNNPFTIINTGAVGYTLIHNDKGGMKREAYIKGLYIEVNGNEVVVKGRNVKQKQWIFTKKISFVSK